MIDCFGVVVVGRIFVLKFVWVEVCFVLLLCGELLERERVIMVGLMDKVKEMVVDKIVYMEKFMVDLMDVDFKDVMCDFVGFKSDVLIYNLYDYDLFILEIIYCFCCGDR